MISERLTLDDVLGLKYLGKWRWSPDGQEIAWLWDDGGVANLWVGRPDHAPTKQVTEATGGVTDFAWSPVAGGGLALVIDDGLAMAEMDAQGVYAVRPLLRAERSFDQLAWSPDGERLAYASSGALWVYDRAAGSHRQLTLPGRLAAGWQASAPAAWSADGRMLAFGFVSEAGLPAVGIVDVAAGTTVWRSTEPDTAVHGRWLGSSTLLYAALRRLGTVQDLYAVELSECGGERTARVDLVHHSPGDGKGPQITPGPVVKPGGGAAALLLEDDGWAHYYLYRAAAGGQECDEPDGGQVRLTQLTRGDCEDIGHAGDEASWLPDGSGFVYASNRGGLSWRHLWLHDLVSAKSRQLTRGEVTDVQPQVCPAGRRLAFVRCDAYRNMDIWVAPLDAPDDARQLTESMPPAWTPARQVKAQEVVYTGAGGWEIHAQLYVPHGFVSGNESAGRYPALVWVHGGPIRQMRPTWHPMPSYALFYAYHQYLLHQGYVVLVINFRGGTGYGRAFRHGLHQKMGVDDATDVVEAGRYLKALPYVDPERVAVWGLSYGGYMTLHCLTQYPEEFSMGINIAGIWDFAQWTKWVEQKHGRIAGLFNSYLGGEPEESPDLYRQASPVSFKDGLRRPLINLHGVADANVDFAQLDRIVLDCVALGVEYEAYYYPEELHTFRWRRTWADAFPKIERELARRLRPPGSTE